MIRLRQFVFAVSVLASGWYGMMAVHELGHVIGAVLSGGTICQVVLHPLMISRTDVAPNPHPAMVVWMGPLVGSALPLMVAAMVPKRNRMASKLAGFFAGFCLIANGTYIAFGSIGQVGDCGEMYRTGTSVWIMIAFGAATIPSGLYVWHRLGSAKYFLGHPELVSWRITLAIALSLTLAIVMGFNFSPQ